ncbi:BON domain-containing protein [Thermoleptolyngbya sp. M55_K2018_002]|jgi:osmotically-inducible protein OsmY|uniref:BON domain-containing protein n=1 Tax=Thermoleptolyngbya sp. M55_K2018_002 TaxID=2747808 RepID=UPI0019EE6A44|nr:BON domain-containing protein [Thermoleptolyngbya sp. M55_K2018_002]HIK39720.1 BON domain-containing protein [Thermoleptolyngbya sp. M55_K2018_002]
MGWLSRLFPGSKKPANASVAPAPAQAGIPPEKVGLDGAFDESGLAKRVALAFDEDPQLDDLERLWVAQLGSKVVLKGEVPSQDYLSRAVSIARGVNGATDVDTSQVKVG